MAKSLVLGVPGDKLSEPETTVDTSHFIQISTLDLYTLWDDKEFNVIVYRCYMSGKIVLRYPIEGDVNADEFEGHRPDEKFVLRMS